jgi:DNA-binding PadR family transcriptional regulator
MGAQPWFFWAGPRDAGPAWSSGEDEYENRYGPPPDEWAWRIKRHAARGVARAAWKAWKHAEEESRRAYEATPAPGGSRPGHRGPKEGPGYEWAREFERTFKRGFGGWGGGFGPPFSGGPGRPGGPGERKFGRGDIKYLLLDLLRERPMHGYEMIKELEAHYGGFYAPSPGSVYPTLQLLEDRGFVTADMVDGKKVYTITAAGREFLSERADHVEGLRGRGAQDWGWGPGFMKGMQAVGTDAWELGRLVMLAVQQTHDDPARLERVRGVLARAREELEKLLREPDREEPGWPADDPRSTMV